MYDFQDKTLLLTGANGGIGRAWPSFSTPMAPTWC